MTGGYRQYNHTVQITRSELYGKLRVHSIEELLLDHNTMMLPPPWGYHDNLLFINFTDSTQLANIYNNIFVSIVDSSTLIDLDSHFINHYDLKYNCIYGFDDVLHIWDRQDLPDYELDESNIFADPRLVSTDPFYPHLEWNSPCIDAGDPDSPPDPDGTRADIGIHYFDRLPVIQSKPNSGNAVQSFCVYPNPFNSYTQVAFDLPIATYVSICVYDITGKEVIRQPLEVLKAGNHKFLFDGTSLASGCYFLNVKLGNHVDKYSKLVLIR